VRILCGNYVSLFKCVFDFNNYHVYTMHSYTRLASFIDPTMLKGVHSAKNHMNVTNHFSRGPMEPRSKSIIRVVKLGLIMIN
jgi:hypothetical protein